MSIPISLRKSLLLGAAVLVPLALAGVQSTRATATASAETGPAQEDGGLLLRESRVARSLPAVRLGTDMDVTVTGQVARVRVTQAFRNVTDKWMEATYLYPLPEDGAVDSLKMVVGQRIFVGKIKPREEAKAIYEKAKAEGQKAGLAEEERPNLFRNSVANIGPHETVLVSIEFQAPVRQLGGEYALRLPLVAGLRYAPPHSIVKSDGAIDAGALADAQAVNAPVLAPSQAKGMNPVTLTVNLSPGFKPANVISPYQPISVTETGATERKVTLAAGSIPANRDFELRWRSAGADPTVGLFRQQLNGQDYVMATITPPAAIAQTRVPPREMIFVIDNSGSMGGESMDQAKASLLHALGTLRPEDSFNVIRFDDTMTRLFDQSTRASADQIAIARRFTEGLEASGGTEMLPALKAALEGGKAATAELRQVVFLTDGGLTNEREMMREIAANGAGSRVFMVGIGSAPNNYLMHRLSEAGRGTYTNIGSGDEVTSKMHALLERLKTPAAQNLSVSVDGATLDLAPHKLPDLYAGEPLVLLGRGKAAQGKLTLRGTTAGKGWTQTVDLAQALPSPAVAKLWASRRIADVEAQRASDEITYEDADKAVEALGMEFALVTARTSLIALDETPSRPKGARLTSEELPLLLPAGWDFDHLFGQDPLNPPKAPDASKGEQAEAMELPQTALGFGSSLLGGLGLAALGLLGLLATMRRRKGQAA